MPSFTLAMTSGVTLREWDDEARAVGHFGADDPGAPSRVNPKIGRPHRYWECVVGAAVEARASVPGLGDAPLDSELGGQLFYPWQVGGPAPVGFASPAGQTSVVTFSCAVAGHYTLALGLDNGGGAVIFHVDARTP